MELLYIYKHQTSGCMLWARYIIIIIIAADISCPLLGWSCSLRLYIYVTINPVAHRHKINGRLLRGLAISIYVYLIGWDRGFIPTPRARVLPSGVVRITQRGVSNVGYLYAMLFSRLWSTIYSAFRYVYRYSIFNLYRIKKQWPCYGAIPHHSVQQWPL